MDYRISSSSGEVRETLFSLPENLGVVAALQRCPTPRLLAGVRLRTYFVCFFSSIIFLKPRGNIPTEGIKIITILRHERR